MNKTTKQTDFTSIITQVSKPDETNRSIQLTNATVASDGTSTPDGNKGRTCFV